MQLFGSIASPFVRHCRIALNTSGLDYEFVETAALASTSPTKRVPYLQEGDLLLTDSSSILRYVRERSGQPFIPDARAFDVYCMANTVGDAMVNVYLFERLDQMTASDSGYLRRQQTRVASGLKELDGLTLSTDLPPPDTELRIACLLDWALYRKRLELSDLPQLSALLERARAWAPFAETAPE